MAAPAQRLERTVEERIARLESHVEHMQTDITEMKTDIRRLDQKFDSIKDSIADLRLSNSELRLSMERSFTKLTQWGFTLYIALAAGLLGVMAKSFGWIK
jgi:predicted RNase H-like nuclease (RuvC/YqgF family)